MKSWKEISLHRKAVRNNEVEQRTVSVSKSKPEHPWLVVGWEAKKRRYFIWGSYPNETFALKQMDKMSFWRMFLVERTIFVSHYKDRRD